MSHLHLALPSSALHRGFRGCSSRLEDFGRLGDFAIGLLSETRNLFVLLGNEAWACGAYGAVSRLAPATPLLEGAIVPFVPDAEEEVACPPGPNQFVEMISRMTPSPNFAYAVRIGGMFSSMRISSIPDDGPVPGREVGTLRCLENVRGILLGFYLPALLGDVAWAGYRFHFLSEDHSVVGRLVDCEIETARVALQHLDECRIALPKTSDFQLADF